MKKALVILAIAAVLTFAMTAVAFADHSPVFYVQWNAASTFNGYGTYTYGNLGSGSPHQNYLEGTEKCAVCHSVHRAPVWGTKGDTSPTVPASVSPVAGGQYDRQEFDTTLMAYSQTQMLLQSSVSNSCDYCHILTSVGGKQLYAGNPNYRTEGTGLDGSEWDAGFAHHNGCTGCHAVHGAADNYGQVALYGQYGTFQGAIKSKVLKVRAKGSGAAFGNQASYQWQDETVAIGSVGKAEMAAAGGAYPAWAAPQVARDWVPGTAWADGALFVDPKNVPLFPSPTDAINGTNVRPDATAYDAQSGVFCTFCHQNYGYASEATVNPDGDRSLFQGPWWTLGNGSVNPTGTQQFVTGVGFQGMGSATGQYSAFKNHPVKPVSASLNTTFVASGKSSTVATAAFADASTCVSCHDAGINNRGAVGVIIESYPHFTPGYFHFSKSGAYVGAAMQNDPVGLGLIPNVVAAGNVPALAAVQGWLENVNNYDAATTVSDGQCIKCHVADNSATGLGVGKSF